MKISGGSMGKSKTALRSPNFPEYARHFTEQVNIYKKLAMSSWNDALPIEKKRQEKNIASFKKLEKVLERQIKNLSAIEDRNSLNEGIAATTVFMYLYDKILEMHKAVLKKNKVGLYAVFDTTRNTVYKLLSNDYFKRPLMDITKDYFVDEALLVACAELAEVELIAIQDAVPTYQPKLEEKLLSIAYKKQKKSSKKR